MLGRLVALTLMLSLPAWAYLDPGTGNLIAQMVAGCVAGCIFAWSALKSKVTALFQGKKKEPEQPESDDAEVSSDENSSA